MKDGKKATPHRRASRKLWMRSAASRAQGHTSVEDVFVTSGVSETVDLCLSALLNPGDNLLTPSPDYPLYSAVLAKLGIELNTYALNEDDGWQPDLIDVHKKIGPARAGSSSSTPTTRPARCARGGCWKRLRNWRGGRTWSSSPMKFTTS